MNLMKKFLVLVGAMAICFTLAGSGRAVFIDFENLPVGAVVTNQFSPLGVTFSLLEDAPVPGPVIAKVNEYIFGTGKVIAPTDNLTDVHYDIQMNFSSMVNYVSFWALDCDERLTVKSYNDGTLVQQNYYTAIGADNLQEYLVVLGNIHGTGLFFDRVIIDVVKGGLLNSPDGGPEYFDNLTFASIPHPPPPPPVPVPGTLILFGSGLLFVAGLIMRST